MSWNSFWKPYHSLFPNRSMVEPGRRINQLTVCARFYHLAYNDWGAFAPICFNEEDPGEVETNGYTDTFSKWFEVILEAPSRRSYDLIYRNWASRKHLADTKNQWSFFRQSPQGINALEWHHICMVYDVPGKNTGIVFNGKEVANRNHSELWANDDNFFTPYSFQPMQYTGWRRGRYL